MGLASSNHTKELHSIWISTLLGRPGSSLLQGILGRERRSGHSSLALPSAVLLGQEFPVLDAQVIRLPHELVQFFS